ARGAPEARIYTVDKDPERLSRARDYLDRAGVVPRVQLLEGAALELLPTIDGPIDLIYLDAVKTEYSSYVELLLPALRKGGLILADNLLWKGWVADPPAEADGDADTGALRAFATYLTTHPRLEALVLPLGDGVGLATKVA
ncbi:MAG: class I SAM-dependent methyltransferase, partial [Holophagales bacterium]|nr:class I SAM-dependent methyltransferase [Holophagales bacterium]